MTVSGIIMRGIVIRGAVYSRGLGLGVRVVRISVQYTQSHKQCLFFLSLYCTERDSAPEAFCLFPLQVTRFLLWKSVIYSPLVPLSEG